MTRIRGVDVSTYQGVISDEIAASLVAEGCVFAYVRAAVGNEARPDDRLKANVDVFKRHGIAVGPYLFPYPLPKLDPVAQAEHHFRLAEGLGSNVGELAPAIDAEWPPRESRAKDGTLVYDWRDKWGCTPAQLRDWLARYGARIDELSGCDCPLYTYRYWWDCIEGWNEPALTARRLWLADYGYKGAVPTDEQLAKIKPPRGFEKITILQHDGDGGLRLPTAKGANTGNDVDWNVMADPNDLFKLLGQPREPLPPPTEIADLASIAHAGASGLIVDAEIAAYRRDRIDAT